MEGAFFKLWVSKEELTSPNTLPAVRKTMELRNSREEPAASVGGRRQGGGERGKLSPREATPSHTADRPRFLSKDFPRFWMVDIGCWGGSRLEVSS